MPNFNFDTMVEVKDTDAGEALATTKFNFDSMVPVEDQSIPNNQSVISKFAREIFKSSPTERLDTMIYIANNPDILPDKNPGEDFFSWMDRANKALEPREKEIVGEGIGRQLKAPMEGAIGAGVAAAPIRTAIGLGAFAVSDKFFNLRRLVEEKFPDTAPEVKDIAELIDFGIKGIGIGAMIHGGGKVFDSLGVPRNVNISPETVSNLNNSGNLLPKEKMEIMSTLGIDKKHIDASISGGVPINVPTSKVVKLAEKPYWEVAKHELLGGDKEAPKDLFGVPMGEPPKVSQELIGELKTLQKDKALSGQTVSRLKEFVGVENVKNATEPKIKSIIDFIGDLKPEDKFLSDKQLTDLKAIIKDLPNPEVTPKRIVLDTFGDKTDILSKGIGKVVDPKLVPTVDIKEGHPLIEKTINEITLKMTEAERAINLRNKELDQLVTKAEKSRDVLLSLDEKIKRKLAPQNKEIFKALSGEKVELTAEEQAVVGYLEAFFKQAKEDIKLDKYRKNYVTHLEQPLMEKILNDGLFKAVHDIFKIKDGDIPINVMLELDNIIGSKKFFKYALERKGGLEPTTDIRHIVNQYSSLLETKKALDQILPEAQAITKNLLQKKGAKWQQQLLQNLKGRGLDNNFRNGPMGWLAKTADAVIDYEYLKLLALNWKSPIKNIVAGETNSWIYQSFPEYLQGKKRMFQNPKKAYELASRYGILEGTFADYAQKGIGNLKKTQDLMMIGQKAGEIEIRSSIFASMLTDKEWASGEVHHTKVQKIRDVVAKTQGIFSKWETPLLLQTWYGRMFFQMNRWRITNTSLLSRITYDAWKDVKAGNFKTQATARFGKMLAAYGIGMYISAQFAQAGFKTASQVTESMAQTIDGTLSLFTKGDLAKIVTDNPTLQDFKAIINTIQNQAAYYNVPGAKKAKGKGIEKSKFAPIETTKDVIEALSGGE